MAHCPLVCTHSQSNSSQRTIWNHHHCTAEGALHADERPLVELDFSAIQIDERHGGLDDDADDPAGVTRASIGSRPFDQEAQEDQCARSKRKAAFCEYVALIPADLGWLAGLSLRDNPASASCRSRICAVSRDDR